MAALAGDLTKHILGHSDADKAFRPWWDDIEDRVMYALVIMGMILIPMTFLSGTPLDCTVHPELWYNNYSSRNFNYDDQIAKIARYVRPYAKKYCTEMNVSPFLMYLPFSLFLVPLIIIFIERAFISFFNSDTKLEQFYSCLVKGTLEREDVANIEQENIKNSHEVQQAFRNSSACYQSYLYRTVLELCVSVGLFSFFLGFSDIDGFSRNLFDCNVHGVIFKCIIPNSRFFWVTYIISLTLIFLYMICTLYNLFWILHPQVPSVSVDAFDLLSDADVEAAANAPGPTFPAKGYKPPEVRLDMYFDQKGRDFRLILNLLSETSGLAHAFRILAYFDKHFQRQWRARDIKVIVEEPLGTFEDEQRLIASAMGEMVGGRRGGLGGRGSRSGRSRRQRTLTATIEHEEDLELAADAPIRMGMDSVKGRGSFRTRRRVDDTDDSDQSSLSESSDEDEEDQGLKARKRRKQRHKSIWVLWNDASIAQYMTKASKGSLFEYTVDISPCTEAPVKSFLYHAVPDFTKTVHKDNSYRTTVASAKKEHARHRALTRTQSLLSPLVTATSDFAAERVAIGGGGGSGGGVRSHNHVNRTQSLIPDTPNHRDAVALNLNSPFGSYLNPFDRRQTELSLTPPTAASFSRPAEDPRHPLANSTPLSTSLFDLNVATMYKYSTRFDGLEDGTAYTVSLSTELDGKTITQVTMKATKAAKKGQGKKAKK